MNICLVSQHFPPETAQGGIGTQTWNKARALTRLGHTVHVLSSAATPGPDPRTEVHDGITVHRIQAPGAAFPVYNPPTYWMGYSWAVLHHLRRLTETETFDVIDFPEYGGEGFAYLLDRTAWNWVPVVVQLYAPLEMFARHMGWPDIGSDFHRIGAFMEQTSILLADGLMACSANIADFVAEWCSVPRERINVVYCGVDAEAFRPLGETERVRGRPTVLYVGNVALSKGVGAVVEAGLRLRAKYPDIRVQVVGDGDQGLLEHFRARAREEGAEGNVELVGFIGRDRLPEFYRRADVFCSPAQYEGGVATVYVEAMASGCPVVASTAGGAKEAVVDGETGFLVPPLDVDAVTLALDRILGGESLRRAMGEAGRQRVEDRFAMDRCITRVLDTYQAAIECARHKLNRLQEVAG